MMVFISNGKLHVSAYSGHDQVFDNFLAITVIYNYIILYYIILYYIILYYIILYYIILYYIILYVTLIARKLSKPDDGRYRSKHAVFYCY